MLDPDIKILTAIESLKTNETMMEAFLSWLQSRLTSFYSYLVISDEPKDVYRFQGRISELTDILNVIINASQLKDTIIRESSENSNRDKAHS